MAFLPNHRQSQLSRIEEQLNEGEGKGNNTTRKDTEKLNGEDSESFRRQMDIELLWGFAPLEQEER